MGPLRDVARDVGGALAGALDGRLARGRARRRARRAAARRGRARRSRTCTGPTTRRSTSSRCSAAASCARPGCLILTCRSERSRAPEVRRVLARAARASACAGSSRRRCRADAVALLARARRARRRRPARGLRRQPVLRHRGARRARRRRRAGERARRRRPARRRARRRRRARSSSSPRSSPARPSCGCSPRRSAPTPARSTRASPPACSLLRGDALAFRHDLARRAVEDEHLARAPPRARPASCSRALEARGDADPARLVHHARRAGDAEAIRRLAPAAARAAERAPAATARRSSTGRRRSRPRRAASDAGGAARASRSRPTCAGGSSARSRRAARCSRIHEAAGDALRAGDDLRWLVAHAVVGRARARRRPRPATARSRCSRRSPTAASWRWRSAAARSSRCWPSATSEAIALGHARGRRWRAGIGDDETVAHALTNVGTALLGGAGQRARPRAARGGVRARRRAPATTTTPPARSSTSPPGTLDAPPRRPARRRRHRARAARSPRERELDGYVQYMLGVRANLRLLRGEWADGRGRRARVARAGRAARRQPVPGAASCSAACRRAAATPRRRRRSTRRGERAVATGELQRLAPAAAARAEHAWLDGDLDAASSRSRGRRTSSPTSRGDAWARAELALVAVARAARRWRRAPDDPPPVRARDRRRLARRGGARGRAIGFPYERAEALADADDEEARLEALASFDALGAARAASHLRRRLRADGVRRIPRGPRPASRAGPGRADAARDRGPRPDRARAPPTRRSPRRW